MFSFSESFIGKKFDKSVVFSARNDASICDKCFKKFEEYDKICLQAAKIQDEILISFDEAQTKLHDSKNSFLRCESCFMMCNSYDEMNGHDCLVDSVEYIVDDSDEETQTEQLPKTSVGIFSCNNCLKKFAKKKAYEVSENFS
jgi:hypothetical protein